MKFAQGENALSERSRWSMHRYSQIWSKMLLIHVSIAFTELQSWTSSLISWNDARSVGLGSNFPPSRISWAIGLLSDNDVPPSPHPLVDPLWDALIPSSCSWSDDILICWKFYAQMNNDGTTSDRSFLEWRGEIFFEVANQNSWQARTVGRTESNVNVLWEAFNWSKQKCNFLD